MQYDPGYSCEHSETTKVSPAAAETPQAATFTPTSVLVLRTENGGQKLLKVDGRAVVGVELGSGVGRDDGLAVGAGLGRAVGFTEG